MSFSAATCLTYTGNTTLGGTFHVYTSTDNSTFTYLTMTTLAQVTTGNCPYYFTVPDNTITVRLIDTLTGCYTDIPVKNSNICSTCNLNFKNISNNLVGSISVGNLTGSCQNNISDYLINWYGPDSLTNLAFSSGSGATFPYQYTHPLTGFQSIPAAGGVYVPKIENVKISGYSFSTTGGTGNILANFDCLEPVVVQPCNCGNKSNTNTNFPYSGYNHNYQFNVQSNIAPRPLYTAFDLSAGTKYFSWQFQGETIPDRFTLYYSGYNSTNLIGLEDFVIGENNVNCNLNYNTYPKTGRTGTFFSKITTLTSLTVSNYDKLIIKITPSTATTLTNWDVYFTCITDYKCSDCITDPDSYYKISGSSITAITASCNSVKINFFISGCGYDDFYKTDYIKNYVSFNQTFVSDYTFYPSYTYGITPAQPSAPNSSQRGNLITGPSNYTSMYFTNNNCNFVYDLPTRKDCAQRPTPTYYEKISGAGQTCIWGFTGDSVFISGVYQSWFGYKNYLASGTIPFSTDPTQIAYYRYVYFRVPISTTVGCTDPPPNYGSNAVHLSFPIETGTTGLNFYLKITGKTITNQITTSTCDINCKSYLDSFVNNANNYVTGSSTNYNIKKYDSGFYYINNIESINFITSSSTNNYFSYVYGSFNTHSSTFNTYPFTGDSQTYVPSLSGCLCSNYVNNNIQNLYNQISHTHYKYYYYVKLTNPNNLTEFDILAYKLTNGAFNGLTELAYRVSAGTIYSNSTYII
jgi:hypothetical protein